MHLCYRISHILFPHLDLHRGDTMWNEALVQLAGIVCFDKQLWWCGKRLSAWSPSLKLDNMTSLAQQGGVLYLWPQLSWWWRCATLWGLFCGGKLFDDVCKETEVAGSQLSLSERLHFTIRLCCALLFKLWRTLKLISHCFFILPPFLSFLKGI